MPTLDTLPVELITLVVARIRKTDLLRLRLVSKSFQSTFESYVLDGFFQTRYHMISRESLDILFQLSEHPKYGPSVHTLVLSIGHLTEDPKDYPFEERDDESSGNDESSGKDEGNYNHDNKAPSKSEVYVHYFNDQTYLKESGLDIAYLTKALSKLSNCKEICFSSEARAWGYASQQKAIENAITRQFDWHPDSVEFVQRIIHVTIVAAKISGIQLETLDLLSARNGNGMAIPPNMLVWPKLSLDKVQFSLPSLIRLYLYVEVESHDIWPNNLIEFIGAFPGLEILDLSFTKSTEEKQFRSVLEFLHIPRLTTLTLLDVCCSMDDLSRLIHRHKDTLVDLRLGNINIVGEMGWQALLSSIRGQPLLTHLILMNCQEEGKLIGISDSKHPDVAVIEYGGEDGGDWQKVMNVIYS